MFQDLDDKMTNLNTSFIIKVPLDLSFLSRLYLYSYLWHMGLWDIPYGIAFIVTFDIWDCNFTHTKMAVVFIKSQNFAILCCSILKTLLHHTFLRRPVFKKNKTYYLKRRLEWDTGQNTLCHVKNLIWVKKSLRVHRQTSVACTPWLLAQGVPGSKSW